MKTDQRLLAKFGLRFNPFLPHIPGDALWSPPGVELFLKRVESLVQTGGFALICGDPGTGKSKTLHLLARHLEQSGDVMVGVMERPQSGLGDFYRELGDRFGVNLTPANRYGGFKALRVRWRKHIASTLLRPIVLVDEAQEVHSDCLNELRLLSTANFDSESILTTVLCGDKRLQERFRFPDLVSLETRIRSRFALDGFSPDDLKDYLDHSLDQAGAPHLMTEEVKSALCDHAAGNLRLLTNMGSELLSTAAEREIPQIDEQMYFEVFAQKPAPRSSSAARKGRKR